MKSQYLIGKYLQFSLITAVLLSFSVLTLAFPNQRVHLVSRRNPSQEGVVSLWRRQAKGGKLVSELLDSIKEALNVTEDPNSCTNCSDIKKENNELKKEVAKNENPMAKKLKPAYDCDRWENKSRICWLDRNVGDTVTFVLAFAEGASPKVQWRQEFHMLRARKTRKFDIDPDNPMWNVVIGSRGHELRLSPVTEMDVDANFFSASVITNKESGEKLTTQTVNFRIRVMPVDQGSVYPGETLRLTMKSADLPPTAMSFQWYLESGGEERSLPSNMKVSPSGSVLTITELRKEQEGVLACSVYTNLGVLATKKRFLIKEINQSNNQLLFEPTRPGILQRLKRDLVDKAEEENLKWASFRLPSEEQHGIEPRAAESRTLRYDEYDTVDDGYKTERRRIQDREVNNQDTGQEGNPNQQGAGKEGMQDETNGPVPQMYQQPGQSKNQVVLEIERQPDVAPMNAQEAYSKLISSCVSDLHCSSNAGCVQREPDQPGFCRCNSGFQGSGIFCWEENQPKNSAVFSSSSDENRDMVKTLDRKSRNDGRGFES